MNDDLTVTNAASTYQTIASMANYLSTTSANNTFQAKISASLPLSLNLSNVLSIDLSGYYNKTETDTAITNLVNKGVTIKNDNDTNNALVVNNSSNSNLLVVSGSGNTTVTGTLTWASIFSTGATGLIIKME
jgi:hypothetical protein